MFKRLLFAYLAGGFSALALALYGGAESIIQAGLKLEAAQQTYAFTARPMGALDESDVPALLAEAPKAKRRK